MTDAITLARQEVEAQPDVRDGLEEIRSFAILTDDDQEVAAEVLRDVKGRHKELEEKRKAITGPLNQALREVNGLFRPVTDALKEGERLLKEKIATYQKEKAERNARRLAEAASAATWEQAEQALTATEESASPEGVSVRHVWKPVVVDPRRVPREFLSVDMAKLEAHAKRFSGEPKPVAGVRFEKKAIVTARA